eukprot:1637174-Prymnesium_polylepis.2
MTAEGTGRAPRDLDRCACMPHGDKTPGAWLRTSLRIRVASCDLLAPSLCACEWSTERWFGVSGLQIARSAIPLPGYVTRGEA